MWTTERWLIALISLLVCVTPMQAEGSEASDVLVLNAENFDQYVDGSANVMVEFYAPW